MRQAGPQLQLAAALVAATVLTGCGSMLPPPQLSVAEHARIQAVGRLGSVVVDSGPQRPSTALFERMLTRTDLFTQVVRLDPASPATPPTDYVATIEGRCTYHRGGWLPILPILTLGVVPQFGRMQLGFPFALRDTRSGEVIHVPCEIDGWIGVGWIPAVMTVLPGWTQDDPESGPRFERRLAYGIASRLAPARASSPRP
jgi:hypothetical protein